MSTCTAACGGEDKRYQQLKRLRREWTRWLTREDWGHFVTLTFGRKVTQWKAEMTFAKWIRRLEGTAHNRVDWFVAYERDSWRRLHIHALTKGTDELYPAELVRAWGGLGYATAPKFDTEKNGIAYLVKRVGEPEVFYDIRENFDGEVPPGEPFGRKELLTAYLEDDLVEWD